MPGTLYLCATPIGNLEDITLRVLRVLKEVDVIVAEDSRRTRQLLSRYGITTPLAKSLYQGVEEERTEAVLELLRAGKNVALVSDAGTPLISDPGFPLVRACVEEGIPVVPVPGPSAVLAALVAAGLPPQPFLFAGYPPRGISARRTWLSQLLRLPYTVVFFESPKRLLATLALLAELAPERQTVVARELTKVHEEFVRGSTQAVHAEFARRGKVLGEVVVLFAPSPEAPKESMDQEAVLARYQELLRQGLSPSEARKRTAKEFGIPARQVYQIVLAARKISP
ncbi:16S rRNA (cytidine(1402)-2'-O)-methyltransferase [Candidatus Bipolaricaulota bacterium]|nr:16S rRNA (cytidine(1402)-2'-O)-methyltransferase [Candidatus Bipolaricaulota bacterium]